MAVAERGPQSIAIMTMIAVESRVFISKLGDALVSMRSHAHLREKRIAAAYRAEANGCYAAGQLELLEVGADAEFVGEVCRWVAAAAVVVAHGVALSLRGRLHLKCEPKSARPFQGYPNRDSDKSRGNQ